uniref:long-chain-fatty-acid--CoA ligase n=1 Tax=Branchiostoma floridae TaxID=7739 RepID=C3YQX0_BRAFL|eukprot:XP_002601299.1 hypothetical protein BRAFLDRAFT_81339 [Branchiostoma floridae]
MKPDGRSRDEVAGSAAVDAAAAAADRRDSPLIEAGQALEAHLGKLLEAGGSVLTQFADAARSYPDKPFLLCGTEAHTYGEVDAVANRVANFFHNQGLVAFLKVQFRVPERGHRRPADLQRARLRLDFPGSGESRGQPLLDATSEVLSELQAEGVTIWLQGSAQPPAGMCAWDGPVKRESVQPLPVQVSITAADTLCYIYTSGTTGLPKAAIMTHGKFAGLSNMLVNFTGVLSSDIFYVPLPLYHTSGLGIGLGTAMTIGATLALRGKFSARHFWDDCRRYNATLTFYIGELLRYLCTGPERPDDKDHKLRLVLGAGLSPDVWRQFQERFGVPRIVEYYGMTEGTLGLINVHNKVGVGVASPRYRKSKSFSLIECDIDTGEPIRGKDGKCTEVKIGKPGLLVNKLSAGVPYSGYLGKAELTEKKILRNVFQEGDAYLNTGDLMRIDKEYFIYFVDRLGDTFRWKGENVATTEVAQVLSKMEGVQEVNVYGVKVPGQEGRAGMASIVPSPGQKPDFRRWYRYITAKLPTYARPLFLRLTQEIQVTGTFRHMKTTLVKEGFDPKKVRDPLFVIDNGKKSYVLLDETVYSGIVVEQARL